MEGITTIIQNMGFPIACVIACGWYILKLSEQSRTDSTKREERLFSQLDKFSDSLDNFNSTLVRIDARLEAVEKKLITQDCEKYQ
ncbi:MAG TPA: hypothetical protein H9985_08095 [Candidatus Anaerofilum faecale]|nr:hypothetical protein [Candidatus Anaerofilum faecale]